MVRNDGHVRGELSEFKVAEDLIEQKCRVSYTHGQYPYDLIGDFDGNLLKIQVKTGNKEKNRKRKYRINTEGYEKRNVDLFAGYARKPDEVFYVPFEEAESSSSFAVTFTDGDKLNPSNAERAKLAEDYTFKKVILPEQSLTD